MFYYLTQRWAWKQLTVLDAVRDVSPAAGEVVEQAVNGYCSFESAEAFNMFAHARTEAEDIGASHSHQRVSGAVVSWAGYQSVLGCVPKCPDFA